MASNPIRATRIDVSFRTERQSDGKTYRGIRRLSVVRVTLMAALRPPASLATDEDQLHIVRVGHCLAIGAIHRDVLEPRSG
jgi:hypothetical protein